VPDRYSLPVARRAEREDIAWLDRYHETVRERLSPLLQGDALEWLKRRTAPI
jgi:Xaa-Pro aminopeptidase